MPSLRKVIIYVAIAVAVLWLGGCGIKRVRPAYTKWRVSQSLTKLEPWPGSTDYGAGAWKMVVKAAKVIQKADQELVGIVLTDHVAKFANQPEQWAVEHGKLVLLFAVAFDLQGQPEQSTAGRGTAVLADAGSALRSDWPVQWQDGKPRLAAGFTNIVFFNRPVADEFTALRYRFRYRDLSNVKY